MLTPLKKGGSERLRVPSGHQGDGTSRQEKQEVRARIDSDWTPPCSRAASFPSFICVTCDNGTVPLITNMATMFRCSGQTLDLNSRGTCIHTRRVVRTAFLIQGQKINPALSSSFFPRA